MRKVKVFQYIFIIRLVIDDETVVNKHSAMKRDNSIDFKYKKKSFLSCHFYKKKLH